MDMDATGKKVLIIAGPDFEDRELFYPLYRFQEAGANVKIAGIGEKQSNTLSIGLVKLEVSVQKSASTAR